MSNCVKLKSLVEILYGALNSVSIPFLPKSPPLAWVLSPCVKHPIWSDVNVVASNFIPMVVVLYPNVAKFVYFDASAMKFLLFINFPNELHAMFSVYVLTTDSHEATFFSIEVRSMN